MKEKFCKECNRRIERNIPHFDFPRMPKWHKFIDLSCETFHIHCIKELDKKRNIGDELAMITADMALKTDIQPLILRDGNIVVRGRLDEKAIEIVNYEDFVEFSIPISHFAVITNMNKLETIQNKATSIYLLEDNRLELINPLYRIKLEKLDLIRLKNIIKQTDLKIFDIELVEKTNKKCVMENMKKKNM